MNWRVPRCERLAAELIAITFRGLRWLTTFSRRPRAAHSEPRWVGKASGPRRSVRGARTAGRPELQQQKKQIPRRRPDTMRRGRVRDDRVERRGRGRDTAPGENLRDGMRLAPRSTSGHERGTSGLTCRPYLPARRIGRRRLPSWSIYRWSSGFPSRRRLARSPGP